MSKVREGKVKRSLLLLNSQIILAVIIVLSKIELSSLLISFDIKVFGGDKG